MRRFAILASSVALALVAASSAAVAQQKSAKEQLIGAWSIVSSSTKLPDGTPAWGSKPKGLYIFTADGWYSSHLQRSDRPKFASNSRATGTAEENKAAVLGNQSAFGKYTVDEAGKSFTVKFEGSSYPNTEGTQQTRPFLISGDEMKITNPSPSIGGGASELVLRRAK